MYKGFYYLLLIIIPVIFYCCKDSVINPITDPLADSCGNQINGNIVQWTGPNFFNTSSSPRTYLQGSERYFSFETEKDSVCTDGTFSSYFSASAKDVIGTPIKFDSKISWSSQSENDTGNVQIAGNLRIWNAQIENLDFKPEFGENPASCTTQSIVHFQTLGTYILDTAFLQLNLNYVRQNFYYYEVKHLAVPERTGSSLLLDLVPSIYYTGFYTNKIKKLSIYKNSFLG